MTLDVEVRFELEDLYSRYATVLDDGPLVLCVDTTA